MHETKEIQRMESIPQNMTIQRILLDLESGRIIEEPDFQREYVWHEEMQRELIFSIAMGNPIGVITLWQNKDKSNVVDGLQRLKTIRRFCNDEVYVKGKNALDILNSYNQDLNDARGGKESAKVKILLTKLAQNNPKIFFKDFLERMQVNFTSQEVATVKIFNASEAGIRDYFRRIQNQEKLKAGEIIHAIDSSILNSIITELRQIEINDTMKIKIKFDLGFDADRKEFEKIYFSMIAILERKLTLGAKDNQIIKYAEEIDSRKEEFENNNELKKLISNINSNLNDISDLDLKEKIGRTSLKFLIFLASHNFYGLKSKYSMLDIMRGFNRVSERFKAFHSYDTRNEKVNDAFKCFINLPQKDFEEMKKRYEEISMLRKGSHKLEKFEKRMKEMAELISIDIDNSK